MVADNSSVLLTTLEQTECLCLSVDSGKKIVFVSDHDFLFSEGNSLQIASLVVEPSHLAIAASSIDSNHNRNLLQSTYCSKPATFIWSEFGQGFSCCAFQAKKLWVAYAPIIERPHIIVATFPQNQRLLTLEGGSTNEYADVTFSRDGKHIAAIGKNGLDRKLWIWKLENQASNPKPIVELDYDYFHSSFEFNPCDSSQIALLSISGMKINIVNIIEILDQIFINSSEFTTSDLSLEGAYFTTFTWELNQTILVGTSFGSLLRIDTHNLEKITKLVINGDDEKTQIISPIVRIIITLRSMIIGFQDGRIQFRQRFRSEKAGSIQRKTVIPNGFSDLKCNVGFTYIVAQARNRHLYRLSIDNDHNEECATFGEQEPIDNKTEPKAPNASLLCSHHGMVTALCPVVLAGKVPTYLMMSGGSDGIVRAWNDSPPEFTSSSSINLCLETLDVRSTVTAMAAFPGLPVFAVGTADGALRIILIRHKFISSGELIRSTEFRIDLNVIMEENLCCTPITSFSYSRSTKRLAAGCYSSGLVFIVSIEPTSISVIGTAKTADFHSLAAVFWHPNNDSFIVLIDTKRVLSYVDTSLMKGSPIPNQPTAILKMQGEKNLGSVILSTSIGIDNDLCVSCLNNNTIERFKLPPVEKAGQQTVLDVAKEVPYEMSNPCINLVSNRKCSIVAAGSVSGQITFYKNYTHSGMKVFGTVALHTGPVVAMSFNADGSRAYTSGKDGSFFKCTINGGNEYQPILSTGEYDFLAVH